MCKNPLPLGAGDLLHRVAAFYGVCSGTISKFRTKACEADTVKDRLQRKQHLKKTSFSLLLHKGNVDCFPGEEGISAYFLGATNTFCTVCAAQTTNAYKL